MPAIVPAANSTTISSATSRPRQKPRAAGFAALGRVTPGHWRPRSSTPLTKRPGVLGRETLGQLDGFVDRHRGRRLGPAVQFERRPSPTSKRSIVGRRSMVQPSSSGRRCDRLRRAYSSVPKTRSSTNARCSRSAPSPTTSPSASSRLAVADHDRVQHLQRLLASRAARHRTRRRRPRRARRKKLDVVTARAKRRATRESPSIARSSCARLRRRVSRSARSMRAIADVARVAERDDLGDQRIVIRRNHRARVEVRVDANARAAREDDFDTVPACGAKLLRGSSALMRHSIAWPRATRSRLRVAERLARRDANLLLDEIDVVRPSRSPDARPGCACSSP